MPSEICLIFWQRCRNADWDFQYAGNLDGNYCSCSSWDTDR